MFSVATEDNSALADQISHLESEIKNLVSALEEAKGLLCSTEKALNGNYFSKQSKINIGLQLLQTCLQTLKLMKFYFDLINSSFSLLR